MLPNDISKTDDRIGDDHVFSVEGEQLVTGNIMGFIGYKGTKVTIRSRFAKDENDYFLHYMLQRVFSFNLFDLDFTSEDEMIFDVKEHGIHVSVRRNVGFGSCEHEAAGIRI